METIWLNLAMAGVWYWFGVNYWPILTPISLVVFVYSFAHDWHEDAQYYRVVSAQSPRRVGRR